MKFLNSTVGGSSLVLPSVSTPSVPYAASFNGSNYILASTSIGSTIGDGDFSIFAWIKTSVEQDAGIVSIGNPNSGSGLSLLMNLFGYVGLLADSGWSVGPGSVFVADGDWHFVGVVNSGGTTQLYVDGSTDSSTGSISISPSSESTLIGYAGSYGGISGDIEEVTIFNRALSGGEITTLYNNGFGLYGNINDSPWSSDLVAGYHLNGDFTDYSGNNYTGANEGAVSFTTGFIISPTVNVNPSWTTVLVDSSGIATSFNLETASGNVGRVHTFKDTGNASINNITIVAQSGEYIDGLPTQVIANNYGSITIQSDGTNWFVTAQNPPNTISANQEGAIDIVGQIIGNNQVGSTVFVPGPISGTGATMAGSFGTDTNGLISIWTGTGSGSYGPLAEVYFSDTLPYQPLVQITPANLYAAALNTLGGGYGTSVCAPIQYSTTNSFYLFALGGEGEGSPFVNIQDNTNYQWYYTVTGSPSPPLYGLSAWYMAETLLSTYENGDQVGTWLDNSGNGVNLTASGLYQPTFVTNVQNGLPAVKFIATTASAYSSYLFNGSLSLGPTCTIYTVCRPVTVCNTETSESGINTVYADSHSGNMIGCLYDNTWSVYDGSRITGDNTVLPNNNYIFVADFNDGNAEIISNGTVVAVGSVGTGSSTSFLVGQGQSYNAPFDGYIMEILVYNNINNPTAALNYLNNKWKIY
jgi:Concanavalin A-like lectin/glucanases superfamily